jgi:hypothetical protein
MRADRSRQWFVAGVGDFERHAELPMPDAVAYDQAKAEGVVDTGLGIVGQHQGAGAIPLLRPAKASVAGKAVLRHRIAASSMAQLIALQPADDREQDGRMTPPGRTSLPQKLGSLGIAQGDEFGPLPDYGRRDAVTMQRQAVLFHMSSRVAMWPAG